MDKAQKESKINIEELKNMRAISAPPGFSENEKQEPEIELNDQDEIRKNPQYYEYYYSQKILDPRLPKPLYKPPIQVNHLMLQKKEISFDYIQYIESQIKELKQLEPNKSDFVEVNDKLQRIKLEKQNSRKTSDYQAERKNSDNLDIHNAFKKTSDEFKPIIIQKNEDQEKKLNFQNTSFNLNTQQYTPIQNQFQSFQNQQQQYYKYQNMQQQQFYYQQQFQYNNNQMFQNMQMPQLNIFQILELSKLSQKRF